MSDVKCNCPWNPDSHHETCPVYMRDRIADLAADNQRLKAGYVQARSTSAYWKAENIAGNKEIEKLEGENQRLRKALQKICDIELAEFGGDWDEIEEAQDIATTALNKGK